MLRIPRQCPGFALVLFWSCGMAALAQPAPRPIGIQAEILNRETPRFSRFSMADALRMAYPAIQVDGAGAGAPRLRILGVQAATGSFLVLSDQGIRNTGPAWAILVHKVEASQDTEDWTPELLLFQEASGTLKVSARASLRELAYTNIPREDTGSRLTLSTLPLAESGAALAVTLRTSRGSDNFGEVRATTQIYLLRPPTVIRALDLETESARSESYYSVQGSTSKAESMTASLACAPRGKGGLKDILVSITEETLRDSRRTSLNRRTQTFAWNDSIHRYQFEREDTPRRPKKAP